MICFRSCAAFLAAQVVLMCGIAQAAEIRAGMIGHDVIAVDAGVSKKERSMGLSLGLVTDPIGDRGFFLSPRFEIGGDLNLGGKTNLAYAGLLWRPYFGAGRRFYAEFATGLAVHDGEKQIPNLTPDLTPEEAARRLFMHANHIEFGSRVLFRQAIALGYRFTDRIAADLYFEHFSHGNILTSGPNEGVDVIGLRISHRLN